MTSCFQWMNVMQWEYVCLTKTWVRDAETETETHCKVFLHVFQHSIILLQFADLRQEDLQHLFKPLSPGRGGNINQTQNIQYLRTIRANIKQTYWLIIVQLFALRHTLVCCLMFQNANVTFSARNSRTLNNIKMQMTTPPYLQTGDILQ